MFTVAPHYQIMEQLDLKDLSRNLHVMCLISYFFRLYLIHHTYIETYDVTGWKILSVNLNISIIIWLVPIIHGCYMFHGYVHGQNHRKVHMSWVVGKRHNCSPPAWWAGGNQKMNLVQWGKKKRKPDPKWKHTIRSNPLCNLCKKPCPKYGLLLIKLLRN